MQVTEVAAKTFITSVNSELAALNFPSAVTEVAAKTLITSVNSELAALNFPAGYGRRGKIPEYFRNPSLLQLWASSILYPTFFTVRI